MMNSDIAEMKEIIAQMKTNIDKIEKLLAAAAADEYYKHKVLAEEAAAKQEDAIAESYWTDTTKWTDTTEWTDNTSVSKRNFANL